MHLLAGILRTTRRTQNKRVCNRHNILRALHQHSTGACVPLRCDDGRNHDICCRTVRAETRTIYVYCDGGSDHIGCGWPKQPCGTIQHAISLANSGDSIQVEILLCLVTFHTQTHTGVHTYAYEYACMFMINDGGMLIMCVIMHST